MNTKTMKDKLQELVKSSPSIAGMELANKAGMLKLMLMASPQKQTRLIKIFLKERRDLAKMEKISEEKQKHVLYKNLKILLSPQGLSHSANQK